MTSRSSLRALFIASLVATTASLTGCSGSMVSTPVSASAITVTGNWQFSSKSASASQLPAISGELKGTSTAITGILHADSTSSCISPSAAFAVSGSADANNFVTLRGANIAGGDFTLTGTLATDGKSISKTQYTVSGGSCAFAAAGNATAQSYASITGTYTGTITDPYGDAIPVSVTLTQTPDTDTSGNFSMSGTGTFPQTPCFQSPASVTNAQVTGGSFSMTYTDPNTSNSITGSGTFSTDASTLTLSGWQQAGPCGTSSGTATGVLTRQ